MFIGWKEKNTSIFHGGKIPIEFLFIFLSFHTHSQESHSPLLLLHHAQCTLAMFHFPSIFFVVNPIFPQFFGWRIPCNGFLNPNNKVVEVSNPCSWLLHKVMWETLIHCFKKLDSHAIVVLLDCFVVRLWIAETN